MVVAMVVMQAAVAAKLNMQKAKVSKEIAGFYVVLVWLSWWQGL